MAELGAGGGSSYPSSIDVDASVETAITTVRADVPNDLANAIIKIETELGTDPAGTQTDVKTYLQKAHDTDGSHQRIIYAWEPPYNCPVDGTTNCQSEIQAAIDAAELQNSTVILPDVDMVIESGLTITKAIKLHGLGSKASVIKPDDNFEAIEFAATVDNELDGLVVTDIGITYSGTGTTKIAMFQDATTVARCFNHSLFQNIIISGAYHGFRSLTQANGVTINNMRIESPIAGGNLFWFSDGSYGHGIVINNLALDGASSAQAFNLDFARGVSINGLYLKDCNAGTTADVAQFDSCTGVVNGMSMEGCTVEADMVQIGNSNLVFNGFRSKDASMAETLADNKFFGISGSNVVFNSPRLGGDAECNDTVADNEVVNIFHMTGSTSTVIVNGWEFNTDFDGAGSTTNISNDTNSQVVINQTGKEELKAVSANYSINPWLDKHIQASNAITVTLPDATEHVGKVFTIERDDATNDIAIDVDTSGNIGDQATVTMAGDGDSITVRSDGTDWQIVSVVGLVF